MTQRRVPKWLEAARTSAAAGQTTVPSDWLGRALSRAGVLPFEAAEKAVRSGRVTVDGELVRDPFWGVSSTSRVVFDGAAVSLATQTIVLMLHKPVGIVTAARDPEGNGTVFEALLRVLPVDLSSFGWHAVGRLDRHTSGLLLFTHDERFVAHATSPATQLPKRYVATVDGRITEEQISTLAAGVTLEDGPAHPASVRARSAQEIEIVLTEGRHHEVRRLLNAVRFSIRSLKREAIGTVVLDVPEGTIRRLSDSEVHEGLGFSAVPPT